jgi:hypothetical protein
MRCESQDETIGQTYWKQKYITFYTKSWQWDINAKGSFVSVTNSNFTAIGEKISEEYYGIRYLRFSPYFDTKRTARGVNSGTHFFEIKIDSQGPELDNTFDESKKMYFG